MAEYTELLRFLSLSVDYGFRTNFSFHQWSEANRQKASSVRDGMPHDKNVSLYNHNIPSDLREVEVEGVQVHFD